MSLNADFSVDFEISRIGEWFYKNPQILVVGKNGPPKFTPSHATDNYEI